MILFWTVLFTKMKRNKLKCFYQSHKCIIHIYTDVSRLSLMNKPVSIACRLKLQLKLGLNLTLIYSGLSSVVYFMDKSSHYFLNVVHIYTGSFFKSTLPNSAKQTTGVGNSLLERSHIVALLLPVSIQGYFLLLYNTKVVCSALCPQDRDTLPIHISLQAPRKKICLKGNSRKEYFTLHLIYSCTKYRTGLLSDMTTCEISDSAIDNKALEFTVWCENTRTEISVKAIRITFHTYHVTYWYQSMLWLFHHER